MYRTGFLGCGPRAQRHAEAYRYVRGATIACACDRNPENLEDFGRRHNVPALYADPAAMIEKERPDLLHLVTYPDRRVEPMTMASELGVPAIIVEKPIALWGEDWRTLDSLERSSSTRFVVNTQLHFHRANLELAELVSGGGVGEVFLVDCSARSTILDQGVHVLELAHTYAGFAGPTRVFAQVSGATAFSTRQPSPDSAVAFVDLEDGRRVHLVAGPTAPRATSSDRIYHHKRICVQGSHGYVHWTMDRWERQTTEAGYESGVHDYTEEDDRAQGRLTEEALALLDDPTAAHPTSLRRSLEQFNIILGAYVSALERRPVDLPVDPPAGLHESLIEALRR